LFEGGGGLYRSENKKDPTDLLSERPSYLAALSLGQKRKRKDKEKKIKAQPLDVLSAACSTLSIIGSGGRQAGQQQLVCCSERIIMLELR